MRREQFGNTGLKVRRVVRKLGRKQTSTSPGKSGRLDKAISKARMEQGTYFQFSRDELDSRTLRLEVLRLELARLIEGRKEANRFVELALMTGEKPRLWIDLTSYVLMEPDARTYRLVRDRQDASEILLETNQRQDMVDGIIHYIAHRVVERERELAPSVKFGDQTGRQYSSTSLVLAWLSGLLLGVIALFLFGVWYG